MLTRSRGAIVNVLSVAAIAALPFTPTYSISTRSKSGTCDQTKSQEGSARELFIDPTDGRSLASQIYAQLRDAITDGRLVTGDRLPPGRMLARDLGVSRFTVTDAHARLSAEGLIDGRAGVVCATSTRAAVPVAASALAPTPGACMEARADALGSGGRG